MIEAVANGSQQLVTEGATNFGAWIPSISVVEAPYIWRDPQHLIKASMVRCWRSTTSNWSGARHAHSRRGVLRHRHVTTSTKAVNTLADMKGSNFECRRMTCSRRWPRAGARARRR